LGVPVVKVVQVDDSHCIYLHIVFAVRLRETIWRATGSDTRVNNHLAKTAVSYIASFSEEIN